MTDHSRLHWLENGSLWRYAEVGKLCEQEYLLSNKEVGIREQPKQQCHGQLMIMTRTTCNRIPVSLASLGSSFETLRSRNETQSTQTIQNCPKIMVMRNLSKNAQIFLVKTICEQKVCNSPCKQEKEPAKIPGSYVFSDSCVFFDAESVFFGAKQKFGFGKKHYIGIPKNTATWDFCKLWSLLWTICQLQCKVRNLSRKFTNISDHNRKYNFAGLKFSFSSRIITFFLSPGDTVMCLILIFVPSRSGCFFFLFSYTR